MLLLAALLLAACTGPERPATPTPTAAPVVLATPVPTATAAPTPVRATPIPPPPAQATAVPSPVQRTSYVTNTGGQGLTLRQAPGGAAVGSIPADAAVTESGEEQREGDRVWRKVRDGQGREGWVAAEFLTEKAPDGPPPGQPAAASSPEPRETAPVATAAPTWPVPLIPTATLRPPESIPTRTPRPALSPLPLPLPPANVPLPAPTTPPLVQPVFATPRTPFAPTRTPTR